MENLKILVNSEAEAEEVKRLAVKAGYTLDSLFGKKWSAEFCYLLLCEDMSAGFANEIMADGDKPLSIGELRAMANPMKEYLVPQNAGGLMYKKAYKSKSIPDSWIEILEGAEALTKEIVGSEEMLLWWRDNFNKCIGHDDHLSNHEIDVCNHLERNPKPVILWQRDQDEPFLTPECTLNDQYAEIEQVRQVEIHGTVKTEPDLNFEAAQESGGVDATLAERQSQYGCYEDVAHVTQQILSVLRIGNYDELPAPMKESLHMIASKMARIVNGDPNLIDGWHDIAGYATLIEKLIGDGGV